MSEKEILEIINRNESRRTLTNEYILENGKKIIVNFYFEHEVDGTYVIKVSIKEDGNQEKIFEVNCQYYITHDYKQLDDRLTCLNQSGGDIYDSGLNEYLDSVGIYELSDNYLEIEKSIVDLAECYLC